MILTESDLKTFGVGTYRYLNQDTVWQPKPPRDQVAIADMDPEWRWNSGQFLLHRAAWHADAYGWGEIFTGRDIPDDVANDMVWWDDERRRDPQAWMRTTKLYRALIAGLPARRRQLTELADRARHWSHCPARMAAAVCSCEAGPDPDQADVAATLIVVRDIRAKARQVERERREVEEREARQRALREWLDANPGLDPDTGRPWGVDEDGVDHHVPHMFNVHCWFDSCSGCGGYHCGSYCPGYWEEQP